MKVKMVCLLLGLFLIPIAQAIPFKHIKLVQNFTSPFYAGDTQPLIVSFDDSISNFTLEINITENTNQHPVWRGDFSLDVYLNSYPMTCDEISDGLFHCGINTHIRESKNILIVNTTPKPNLYPSVYTFDLTLNGEIPGFKAEGTGCVWKEVERCLWKRCWTRRTRVCKPATLFTDEDKLKLEMEDKIMEWDIEGYDYRRWFETYYGISEEWKRFRANVLWDRWVYAYGSEASFSGRIAKD